MNATQHFPSCGCSDCKLEAEQATSHLRQDDVTLPLEDSDSRYRKVPIETARTLGIIPPKSG